MADISCWASGIFFGLSLTSVLTALGQEAMSSFSDGWHSWPHGSGCLFLLPHSFFLGQLDPVWLITASWGREAQAQDMRKDRKLLQSHHRGGMLMGFTHPQEENVAAPFVRGSWPDAP